MVQKGVHNVGGKYGSSDRRNDERYLKGGQKARTDPGEDELYTLNGVEVDAEIIWTRFSVNK